MTRTVTLTAEECNMVCYALIGLAIGSYALAHESGSQTIKEAAQGYAEELWKLRDKIRNEHENHD